jgi:TRAP-type C4-dicarboxylate transport system permease small subunit
MNLLFNMVHRLEDTLLVVLLSAIILLASTQIVLRNLFDYGLVWADPLLRIMVLWLGLTGATVASRKNKHIRIDLLSRFFKKKTNLIIQALVSLFSTWVCLVIAWQGTHWIRLEYAYEMPGFAGIPAWILEIIIPVSFALIGIRYCLISLRIGRLFYRRIHLHLELRRLGAGIRH